MKLRALVTCIVSVNSASQAQTARPDPVVTPGVVNPEVTSATIGETICRRGWTHMIRPPRQYTSARKQRQLRASGYADQHMSNSEEDHLIPLDWAARRLTDAIYGQSREAR